MGKAQPTNNYDMKQETRINLTDTTLDIIVKMSEGNPGAAVALMEIVKNGEAIDPQSFAGGVGAVLSLDTYGIYGSDIYILWSDICEKNLPKMLAVLRACQLGLFSSNTLKVAASRQDRTGKSMIPVEDLYVKVKEQLKEFDVAKVTA